jgi:hypothetical protein
VFHLSFETIIEKGIVECIQKEKHHIEHRRTCAVVIVVACVVRLDLHQRQEIAYVHMKKRGRLFSAPDMKRKDIQSEVMRDEFFVSCKNRYQWLLMAWCCGERIAGSLRLRLRLQLVGHALQIQNTLQMSTLSILGKLRLKQFAAQYHLSHLGPHLMKYLL